MAIMIGLLVIYIVVVPLVAIVFATSGRSEREALKARVDLQGRELARLWSELHDLKAASGAEQPSAAGRQEPGSGEDDA
ncbi:MAG: hypothetical protein VYD64_09820, partial [Pseudomonadota bacterium]|nr:hypothetical protein [Pseudomonadota bacterium]